MRTILLGLCLLSGCAAFFEHAADRITRGVASGLEASDPQLDRLVQLLGDEVAKVTQQKVDPVLREVVRGVIAEGLDEAFSDARVQRGEDRLARLVARVVSVAGEGMAEDTRTRLGPALRAVLEQELGPALQNVTRAVGPAMAGVLRDDLGPASAQVLDQQLRPVLAGTARELTRGVVDELATALEADGRLDQALARQRTLARQDVQGTLGDGVRAVDSITDRLMGALGVGVVVLGIAAAGGIWLWWRARRQAVAYEHTVTLLTTAIQRHADRDGVGDLVEALRGLDRTADGPAALDRFLNERPWLKVPRG